MDTVRRTLPAQDLKLPMAILKLSGRMCSIASMNSGRPCYFSQQASFFTNVAPRPRVGACSRSARLGYSSQQARRSCMLPPLRSQAPCVMGADTREGIGALFPCLRGLIDIHDTCYKCKFMALSVRQQLLSMRRYGGG